MKGDGEGMYGPDWTPFEGWTPPSISLVIEEDRRELEACRQHRVFKGGNFLAEDHWPSCIIGEYEKPIGVWSERFLRCPRLVRLYDTSIKEVVSGWLGDD